MPTYLDADEWAVVKTAAQLEGKPLARWIRDLAVARARIVTKRTGDLHAFGRPCGALDGAEPESASIDPRKLTCASCRALLGD